MHQVLLSGSERSGFEFPLFAKSRAMRRFIDEAAQRDKQQRGPCRNRPSFIVVNRDQNLGPEVRAFGKTLRRVIDLNEEPVFVQSDLPSDGAQMLVIEDGEQVSPSDQQKLLADNQFRLVVLVTQCMSETLRDRNVWTKEFAQRAGHAFDWPTWHAREEDQRPIIQKLVGILTIGMRITPPDIHPNVYDLFKSGRYTGTEAVQAELDKGLVRLMSARTTTLTANHCIGDALRALASRPSKPQRGAATARPMAMADGAPN